MLELVEGVIWARAACLRASLFLALRPMLCEWYWCLSSVELKVRLMYALVLALWSGDGLMERNEQGLIDCFGKSRVHMALFSCVVLTTPHYRTSRESLGAGRDEHQGWLNSKQLTATPINI